MSSFQNGPSGNGAVSTSTRFVIALPRIADVAQHLKVARTKLAR
jgi:hypothetical protein